MRSAADGTFIICLVGPPQPAAADHVGREDGDETAVHSTRRSSLHGILPGRTRRAAMRTTGEGASRAICAGNFSMTQPGTKKVSRSSRRTAAFARGL